MAYSEITLREATAGSVSFQLLSGTAPINLSAAGTIELWLRDKAGGTVAYDSAGQAGLGGSRLTVSNGAQGSVNWVPGTGDLKSGSEPYTAYFKVLYAANRYYYVPEDSEFTIRVREVF